MLKGVVLEGLDQGWQQGAMLVLQAAHWPWPWTQTMGARVPQAGQRASVRQGSVEEGRRAGVCGLMGC